MTVSAFQKRWDEVLRRVLLSSQAYGTYDEKTRTLTFLSTLRLPGIGEVKQRNVTKLGGPDRHVFEVSHTIPDGMQYKAIQLTYTSRK